MMREIAIKRVKDNWIDEFSNLLDKVENKEFKKALSFYKENYFEGVSRFLVEPKTTGYEDLFTNNGFTDIYVDTYRNIGTSFANWYAKSIGSLLKKQDVSGYKDIWEAAFAEEGRKIAGNRVTLVSGTAKATLKKELKRFMQDPEFMASDVRTKARILRTRFNQYSNYQAQRLVRTEATNAANQGTMRSALDIYGKNELQKEWITANDERVRSNHAVANGQIVDFEDKFLVGGEYLDRAGDPRGSAANVINCRCSIAPFPKQSDQLVNVLPPINPVPVVAQQITPKPVGQVTPETTAQVKTVKEFKEKFANKFNEQDINVNRVSVGRGIDVKDLNKMIDKFDDLSKKYNVSEYRKNSTINLKFTGGRGYRGRVRYNYYGRQFDSQGNIIGMGRFGKVSEIDFGRGYNANDIYSKGRFIDERTAENPLSTKNKISTRGKSVSDKENWEVTTLSHEFAHYIDIYEVSPKRDTFWKELIEIRKEYHDELKTWYRRNNAKRYNEIFLGNYSHTHIDEFFAEAFAEFETRKNPSKYAKLIGELTIKYYGK